MSPGGSPGTQAINSYQKTTVSHVHSEFALKVHMKNGGKTKKKTKNSCESAAAFLGNLL